MSDGVTKHLRSRAGLQIRPADSVLIRCRIKGCSDVSERVIRLFVLSEQSRYRYAVPTQKMLPCVARRNKDSPICLNFSIFRNFGAKKFLPTRAKESFSLWANFFNFGHLEASRVLTTSHKKIYGQDRVLIRCLISLLRRFRIQLSTV